MATMNKTAWLLRQYAEQYESAAFLKDDPSCFMHQVEGPDNQEVMAFLAAALSYGSRKQFFPKVNFMLQASKGQPYLWVLQGHYREVISDSETCFYRLYTAHDMLVFLDRYSNLLSTYGSLKAMLTGVNDAYEALWRITTYFSALSPSEVIPHDVTSSCKRLCMFLRWMVRKDSPVDLGIWSDIIDQRTLIMPLDTHVLTQANRLGLLHTRSTTMSTARKLTDSVRKIFPDDPLKADFALFGYGINHQHDEH